MTVVNLKYKQKKKYTLISAGAPPAATLRQCILALGYDLHSST